ncbi:histidine kinase [Nitrospiraceae bacterium AH_259_D15_M11_P09]|nr:histidine kinase [Nitrospiraceae bacterium AH_259_D15_M11_P09]
MDNEKKAVLVAVSDVFFYTKIRDALLPKGYVLERIRTQDEVPAKAASLHPTAMILNMNDEALDAFKALEQIKGDASLNTIPILAFANHEEVETWRRAKELGVNKIVSRNEFSSRTRDLMEDMLSSQPSPRS